MIVVMIVENGFMELAYKEALKARKEDEVPVGAVIVKDGMVIAKAHNKKEKKNDPTSHAEIECIKKACKKIGDWYLKDCELYVTLEPCVMCVGAIINARISKVYFGARDLKAGALGGLFNVMEQKGFNHYFEYEFLDVSDCGKILSDYFKEKRAVFQQKK
jgi:tRNA(adenine34) deaminase